MEGTEAQSDATSLQTQLNDAVKAGEVGRVRELMRAGAAADKAVATRPGRRAAGETALIAAITSPVAENSECLKALLTESTHPLAQAAKDDALLAAAKYGRADYISLLLEAGAQPNACEASYGNTPLLLAALRSNDKAVEELIQHGADVNAQNRLGDTALHKAVSEPNASVRCVELLLGQPSLNLSLVNNQGECALCRAISRGNVSALNLLLTAANKLEQPQREAVLSRALLYAAKQDNLEALKAVLRNSPPECLLARDELGNTPLHLAGVRPPGNHASKVGHADALLEFGSDVKAVNHDGETALHTNVRHLAAFDFLKRLADHGADIHAKDKLGRSVLQHAILAHSLPALKLLMAATENSEDQSNLALASTDQTILSADKQGDSLLHKLARSEEYGDCLPFLVRVLRHNKIPIPWGQQNTQGATYLHLALQHQNFSALTYILEQLDNTAAALIDIRDQEGHSFLDLVLEEMDIEVLLALIRKIGSAWMDDQVRRTILEARDESGHSLLHKAALCGSSEAVAWCLEFGFKVDLAVLEDATDAYNTGGTALHLASEKGHHAIVQLLIERGANINNQDEFNANTPAHIVAANLTDDSDAQLKMLELLLRSGASASLKNRHDETLADIMESAAGQALLLRSFTRTSSSTE